MTVFRGSSLGRLLSSLLLVRLTFAAILPSSYLSVSFGQTQEDIESYVNQSFTVLVNSVNPSTGQVLGGNPPGTNFFWQSQNAFTSVAQYDLQRGTKQFHQQVLDSQNTMAAARTGLFAQWNISLVDYYNDDCDWAGLSQLACYEAYGDEVFLDRAVTVWDFLSTHGYISQEVIDEGYLQGVKYPNNTVPATQNGFSMIGGMYWLNGGIPPKNNGIALAALNSTINAVATGGYGLLGAELCRLTGNTSYCDRAYLNAQWLDQHAIDPTTDLITASDAARDTFTYTQGQYIALYASLGSLTSNATAIQLATDAAQAAMTTTAWNSDNGIISEGNGDPSAQTNVQGFKAILIRYLHQAYPYLTDSDTKQAIIDYVNIQYYGLSQLDSDSQSQPVNYGRNWTGPGYENTNPHTQLVALDVLNALSLNPASAFPSTSNQSVPVVYSA